jgi:hypothetical protein
VKRREPPKRRATASSVPRACLAILAGGLFASAAAAQSEIVSPPQAPAFYALAPTNPEARQYEAARALALQWLTTASAGSDAALSPLARDAAAQLSAAQFLVAAGVDADRQCAAIRASFFVLQTNPGTIFVCADTRWHVLHEAEPVTDVLAQALAHEAAHLAGTTDECAATSLEVEAARGGGRHPNLGNVHRYAGQCDTF